LYPAGTPNVGVLNDGVDVIEVATNRLADLRRQSSRIEHRTRLKIRGGSTGIGRGRKDVVFFLKLSSRGMEPVVGQGEGRTRNCLIRSSGSA
jgi:hypothetical protein